MIITFSPSQCCHVEGLVMCDWSIVVLFAEGECLGDIYGLPQGI